MSTRAHATTAALPEPRGLLATLGGGVFGTLGYLGGLAILYTTAAAALFRRRPDQPALLPAALRQADWMLMMGLPLIGVAHIGLGSFLAMQAFFGATFVVAAGPVTTLGLIRNMAPLLCGIVLSGMYSAVFVPELRGSHVGLDRAPGWAPDRGAEDDTRDATSAARLVAARLFGAALAGPVLALWGTLVGGVVGLLVAKQMLGVSYATFLGMSREMLWVRDVVGLVVKGVAYATIPAGLACFEGLRSVSDHHTARWHGFRGALIAMLLILLFNNAWFLLIYHAGPPFGPTVLIPPGR